MGVVDVVDDDVALGACYHTDIVAHALGRRLHVGQDAILENDGDGVRQVHPCIALHAVAVDTFDIGIAEHAYKVKGIHAQVE